MLKHTLKVSVLSALLVQGLLANSTEHVFADGATLSYTLPEGSKEGLSSPVIVNEINMKLPFLKEQKIMGKVELAKEGSAEKYTLNINPKIDPSTAIELFSLYSTPMALKATDKGAITIQLSDSGEVVKGSHIIAQNNVSTTTAEELEYSHEYKKAADKEDIYSNVVKFQMKNGVSYNGNTINPEALQNIFNNPYTQFKEFRFDLSYLSSKDYSDYQSDLNATFHAKGHKGFVLESTLKAGMPFAKTPGAEKLEGFTFNMSAPVIDLRIEGEEEKQQLKALLNNNVEAYEAMLEEYSNSFSEKVLTSLRKNKEEIISRNYKYFTEFAKEDIGSFLLSLKGASAKDQAEENQIVSMGEFDLAIRKFILKADFVMKGNGTYNCVVSLPTPETSMKELSLFIRTNAYLLEPIIKDLGYWEAVQNGSDPEKLLSLLRQLSDDPKAKGNESLTLTVKLDANGISVGTLNMERASQLVLGWALMVFPIPIK